MTPTRGNPAWLKANVHHRLDSRTGTSATCRNFGDLAERSSECSYKAVLESHGIEYPKSGGDGHNRLKLVELLREEFGSPGPGENYTDLSGCSGGAWYGDGHGGLDKPGLAREVKTAARAILSMMATSPTA